MTVSSPPTRAGAARSLRFAPHVAVCSVGYVTFTYSAVPEYVTARYDASLAAVGLLMSAALVSFVLAQAAASPLLARTSTTRALLGLLAAHTGLAVVLDLAPSLPAALALRAAWGLAGGLVLSVGATHVSRLYEGAAATRQQGIYGGALTLGGAAGFLVAERVVAATGGFGIHAFGAVLALPAVAMLWPHRDAGRLAETAGEATPDREASSVLHNRVVLAAAACYVALIGSYITLSTFVTAYFTDLHVTGPLNAAVMLVATAARAGGGVLAGRFDLGDARVVRVTGGLAVLAFLALATLEGRAVALVVPLVAMLAVSLPFGAVYSLAASATEDAGAALALVVAAGNVAAVVLPTATGLVRTATGSYAAAFGGLALLNAVAVLALARVSPGDRGPAPRQPSDSQNS